jgi:acyl-coenzyme A synthetase/AMP-(fatty) acid ligase
METAAGIESYEQAIAEHRWEVPDRYNIAADVCDKHPDDKPAMVFEDFRGNQREVSWGEQRSLANRAANVLAVHGVERGDRVAVCAPASPETAAMFLGTWKLGGILLSLSVLYGDEGIAHRIRDSEPRLIVADAGNAERMPGDLVDDVIVLDERLLVDADDAFETADTAADEPAQIYYTSGTTGLAKGILHAHRYVLAHEQFVCCHDVRDGELFHGRRVCSAGEPLNPEAIRWFRDQYGVAVLDYYGLSESYPLCANYPFMDVREGSMGKPMPGWEVEVLDEDENPVAQGERGEICLRARSNPQYPLGYWRNPEATREDFDGDWFHTKDAAERDPDGYFWYAGRADDVIISAGYRIGPFEVESACLEHAAVREAAAVASPDEARGNVVKAFVVLGEEHEASDELASEIQGFVRQHLSAYAYPRRIEFVDELPKTLTGKIRRIELRERERPGA